MTRRRWIADQVTGNRAALTGEHADHLIRVLRASVGQEFDVAANGVVRRARIISMEESRVEFELGDDVPLAPAPKLTLLLAVFKFDRMEWAIEKCTELGVARIIPAIARRTDVHLASAAEKRAERWRRIALQAAEQSRRPNPPEIAAPLKLSDTVSLAGGLRIVLSESEQRMHLCDVVESRPTDTDEETILAVGPEGGWATDELQHFQQAGWISASLGNTILRAETAAIAATAIIISAHR
ncbi:MAG: RsmE family RNA methyltransferase [Candidatus Sulfotelmatobacter sp.]